MEHSSIVGGSTAKRVIACPGSVALVSRMPAKPSSTFADRGTLLHNVISQILDNDTALPEDFLGTTYENEVLTQELIDEKLLPALAALDEIDPEGVMQYACESRVDFGKYLPNAFGSCDLLGRIGNRAIVLDWKFGDGIAVGVEENPQLMFYAAAAMRTKETQWVFENATEIECIIVQPPATKRWITTPARIKLFEKELKQAVKRASGPSAAIKPGEHCRWCAAKPICPAMTGSVERANKILIKELDAEKIGLYLANADILEGWIKDLRALAFDMLDKNVPVPGWKLVAKRATRQWVNELDATITLSKMGVNPETINIISPAQAEKLLKKEKKELPKELVVSVSSGSTLAPESDPRPAVLLIGQQMTEALSKLI